MQTYKSMLMCPSYKWSQLRHGRLEEGVYSCLREKMKNRNGKKTVMLEYLALLKSRVSVSKRYYYICMTVMPKGTNCEIKALLCSTMCVCTLANSAQAKKLAV